MNANNGQSVTTSQSINQAIDPDRLFMEDALWLAEWMGVVVKEQPYRSADGRRAQRLIIEQLMNAVMRD